MSLLLTPEDISIIENSIYAMDRLKSHCRQMPEINFFDYAKNVMRELSAYIQCQQNGTDGERHLQRAFMNEDRAYFCHARAKEDASICGFYGFKLLVDVPDSYTIVVHLGMLSTGLRVAVNRILLGSSIEEVRDQIVGTAKTIVNADMYGVDHK